MQNEYSGNPVTAGRTWYPNRAPISDQKLLPTLEQHVRVNMGLRSNHTLFRSRSTASRASQSCPAEAPRAGAKVSGTLAATDRAYLGFADGKHLFCQGRSQYGYHVPHQPASWK